AYAGTTGVLLAFDIEAPRRAGLLGFAIERTGGNRPQEFLPAMVSFAEAAHTPGELIATDTAPVQRFRWSDYRVYPGTSYSYTVHPVYGTPTALDLQPGPTVAVTTSSATEGEHRVLFNRAAGASQAFSRDFPEVAELLKNAPKKGEVELPPRALAWLSRGSLEQITGFIARAVDPTWALDVAIYEFELPAIVQALDAARERGVDVRIVYHAKPKDPQTAQNEQSLVGWPAEITRARVTNKICHDKFIVLSRIDAQKRSPRAVLCGSTNFTPNGVYRQANVVHIIRRPDVARTYLRLFEVLFSGATPAETKAWIDANNPLSPDEPLVVGFSPRSGEVDLDLFVSEIGKAHRDVLFCTAFDLNDRLESALLGAPHDDILRLGLQNSRSKITGYHRDRTADFNATAFLKDPLDGFLRESTAGQRGNILIHTKLLVVDFTSDAPTVISGSHNLSASASGGNDENFLILRGNTDVADCYGVELMRLYEHYRFRWHVKQDGKQGGPPDPCPRAAGTLCPDDRWTKPYFEDGTLPALDRVRFAGAPA
ncbi:MAG TPA: phospholipase D-like domain-containing protein, partial [Thermoleophilaceae bacterium]